MSRSSLDAASLGTVERGIAAGDPAVQAAAVYDALHSLRKDYRAESNAIARLVRDVSGGGRSLLDVACGTGRHLRFLGSNVDVAGVDASEAMLSIARTTLTGIPLICDDMRTFRLARRFDAVTCLFSSIAYMPTTADLGDAVANMCRHLAPGGVLIVEPWHHQNVWPAGHRFEELVVTDDGAICRVLEVEVVDSVSVLRMSYEVTTGGRTRRFSEEHRLRLFVAEDYVDAMESAGLSVADDPVGVAGRGLFVGVGAACDHDLQLVSLGSG